MSRYNIDLTPWRAFGVSIGGGSGGIYLGCMGCGFTRSAPKGRVTPEGHAALREVLDHTEHCAFVAALSMQPGAACRIADRADVIVQQGPGPSAMVIDAPGKFHFTYDGVLEQVSA